MTAVPVIEITVYVAANSDGWHAISIESAEAAVNTLVAEHGHGVGVRSLCCRLIIELPRPQQLLGNAPQGAAELAMPISIPTKQGAKP